MNPEPQPTTARERAAMARMGASLVVALAALLLGRYFTPVYVAFVALPLLGVALWLAASGGYGAGWEDCVARARRGRR